MANFGPTGETVFRRTYARPKADGTLETWEDTAARVARGNLALIHGPDHDKWDSAALLEEYLLAKAIADFDIIPGGRHLWASGVEGRQFLFNCHAAGWGDRWLSEHSAFLFLRLMEAGGVGANYSSRYNGHYGPPKRRIDLRLWISENHPDYGEAAAEGLLTQDKDSGFVRVADSREGWAEALSLVMDSAWARMGPDGKAIVRLDLSYVRPAGAPLHTFGGTASGPVPLARMLRDTADVINRAYQAQWMTPIDILDIDHAIASCVVAGGVRRAARMSIMHWKDPFIFDFVSLKADTSKHWTTNISVEIDDEFLDALNSPAHPDSEHARKVHAAVVQGMLENGEPGYWNSSLSQDGEVEPVQTTNPCGEIALQPWENCNLGHVNLERFADRPLADLVRAHWLMTRMLIRATFGDVTSPEQKAILERNRRIGVGHFGVQGYLVRKGIRYSDAPDNQEFRQLLRKLYGVVRETARGYAFQLRIPEPVKVTTVAPTGSVAKLPGATEGIHPVYARYFLRRIRFSTIRESEMEQVREYEQKGYQVEPDLYAQNTLVVTIPTKERLVAIAEELGYPPPIVEDVSDIPLETMLRFQAMYQEEWADNAVSMTVNLPVGKYTAGEVADLLARYLPQLKGVTLMTDGTRPQAPYERISRMEYEQAAAQLGIETVDDAFDENCASGACPIK